MQTHFTTIKKTVTLLFFLFSITTSFGQMEYRDSIKAMMSAKEQKDEFLIETISKENNPQRLSVLYNLLGLNYQRQQLFDPAMRCHKTGLLYAYNYSSDNEDIAISYNKIGVVFWSLGEVDSAIFYFQNALPFFSSPRLKANAYNNLALLNNYQANRDVAIHNYLNALELFEEAQDTLNQAWVLNNIGALYNQLKDYEKGSEYILKSLKVGNCEACMPVRNSCKVNLGTAYMNQGDIEKASQLFEEAISFYEEIKDYNSLVITKANLANCYDEIGEFDLSVNLYEDCLRIMEEYGTTRNKSGVILNLGAVYEKNEKYDMALKNYLTAKKLVEENGTTVHLEPIYSNLSTVYKELGKMDSSLYFKDKQLAIRDSLEEVEKEKKMMELEAEHQTKKLKVSLEQQETNLKILEEKQGDTIFRMKYLLVGLILAVVIILLLLSRYQKKKKLSDQLKESNQASSGNVKELKSKLESKNKEIETLTFQKETGKLPYPENLTQLTNREKEVLNLVKEGLKDSEISDRLFISIATVRTHLRKAYIKIDARNRAEAIQFISKYSI